MNKHAKSCVITRGVEKIYAWLYDDNIRYWISKGYTVEVKPWTTA